MILWVVGKCKADKKEQSDSKERQRQERREKEKADDPKAGADVGKIVNLMAGDASKVTRFGHTTAIGSFLSLLWVDFANGVGGVFHIWK